MLETYIERGRLKGWSASTEKQFRYVMSVFSKMVKKPFNEVTEQDFFEFATALKKSHTEYSAHSITGRVLYFLRAVNPNEFGKIKMGRCKAYENRIFNSKDMLNQEDIIKLTKATNQARDKAIINLLWDSGIRLSEMLSLQWKHIVFKQEKLGDRTEFYAELQVPESKTKTRRFLITSSVPYLLRWKEEQNGNEESYIVTNIGFKANGKRTTKTGIALMLYKLKERAKSGKRLNPHFFRHSCVSRDGGIGLLSEADMKIKFGWSKNSKTVGIYMHRDEDSLIQHQRLLAGLTTLEERKKLDLYKFCPHCNHQNTFDAKFCDNCKRIIDLETLNKLHEQNEDKVESLENKFYQMAELFNRTLKVLQIPDVEKAAITNPDFRSLLKDSENTVKGLLKGFEPS